MAFMDQFSNQPSQPQVPMHELSDKLNKIKSLAGGDASGFISYMSQTNPQFAEFANRLRGKTPEQAFAEFGLDYSQFRGIL